MVTFFQNEIAVKRRTARGVVNNNKTEGRTSREEFIRSREARGNFYSAGVTGCAAAPAFVVPEGEGRIRRNGFTLKKRWRHGSQRYAGKPSQRLKVTIEPASTRSREMCSRLKLPQRGQCAFNENAVATFHA